MKLNKKTQIIETIEYLKERIEEQKKVCVKAKERLYELMEMKKSQEDRLNDL